VAGNSRLLSAFFAPLLTKYHLQVAVRILISGMQPQQCLFCGHIVQLVHVHGHYQCPVCTTNALPCCDGDNCNTNQLLAIQNEAIHRQQVKSDE
jgi:hypothetical protein